MKTKQANLSVKMDCKIKEMLTSTAKARGMDLSKLTRAILTNWVTPNTYNM